MIACVNSPAGCDSAVGFTPVCDTLPGTDGTAICPAGCTDICSWDGFTCDADPVWAATTTLEIQCALANTAELADPDPAACAAAGPCQLDNRICKVDPARAQEVQSWVGNLRGGSGAVTGPRVVIPAQITFSTAGMPSVTEEDSAGRPAFEFSFRKGIAAAIDPTGVFVTPADIVIDSITSTLSGRRQLQQAGAGPVWTQVTIAFRVVAPASVELRAVAMVEAVAASGSVIEFSMAGQTFTAEASSMTGKNTRDLQLLVLCRSFADRLL